MNISFVYLKQVFHNTYIFDSSVKNVDISFGIKTLGTVIVTHFTYSYCYLAALRGFTSAVLKNCDGNSNKKLPISFSVSLTMCMMGQVVKALNCNIQTHFHICNIS